MRYLRIGLKQASRVWYERLSSFFIENNFFKGKVDTTLFIKNFENNFLIVQIYVDDIIFSSMNETLCESFAKSMSIEFEMSLMGELTFLLGLQIKQLSNDIFLSQTKYVLDLLKRFNMDSSKAINTPMSTSTKLDIDES